VGRDPRGGGEGLERGAQHTFLQIKIKTALIKGIHEKIRALEKQYEK
jgi:hypothetical protein